MKSKSPPPLVTPDEICIVVPVHQNDLSDHERISLVQLRKTLSRYHRFLVVPKGLNVSKYLEIDNALRVIEFDGKFFKTKRGYTTLCRSPLFYKEFLKYRYLLIHQLDCFVFKDALTDWANKGFDYVGSPWIDGDWMQQKARRWRLPFILRYLSSVGNGGFSLRNISKSYSASHWLRFVPSTVVFHEDVLWSNLAKFVSPHFKIADVQSALNFGFETNPAESLRLNNGHLPFGCHGWQKYEPEFWEKIIASFGFSFDQTDQT